MREYLVLLLCLLPVIHAAPAPAPKAEPKAAPQHQHEYSIPTYGTLAPAFTTHALSSKQTRYPAGGGQCDSNALSGSYTIRLPNGKTQLVAYSILDENGNLPETAPFNAPTEYRSIPGGQAGRQSLEIVPSNQQSKQKSDIDKLLAYQMLAKAVIKSASAATATATASATANTNIHGSRQYASRPTTEYHDAQVPYYQPKQSSSHHYDSGSSYNTGPSRVSSRHQSPGITSFGYEDEVQPLYQTKFTPSSESYNPDPYRKNYYSSQN